ncbi:RecB family exonuclease [Corynebacterium uterequi]|uniref:RecB family exonuclease n=1 Tax=Corynebacterium uterequi TaxID=1072256 RepID=A0A0G3HCP2_9CORY|nr:RecB family exonuclease [Corynebacterium uterequi]AKK11089.1 RecB family exonuclease [Corynebacterium uterequi]
MPSPLALSPSRALDYLQCPLKYRLGAIDKIPQEPKEHLVKGNLVHAVLEKLHQLPRADRTFPAAVKLIKPTYAEMLAKDSGIEHAIDDEDVFFNDCRDLVRGYFRMENPGGFDCDATEKYFEEILPSRVPVRGFIDRVDTAPTGEVRVVDYKTGKKPHPRYSFNAYFQMRFYALVYWRTTGRVPDLLRLMYLKVLDDLVLSPSPEELEAFERDLAELWEKIVADGRSGRFRPKTSKLCDWCDYRELCPEFGGVPPEYPGWPGSTADHSTHQNLAK